MAVCNTFKELTNNTGEFFTFSQYTEDLTEQLSKVGYKVVPSKFLTLNVDYSKYGNKSLPNFLQRYFENGCAYAKDTLSSWSVGVYKTLFWNAFGDLCIDSSTGISSINYIGDINIQSFNQVDNMGYNEIYCYIPNDAKEQEVKFTINTPLSAMPTYSEPFICGYDASDVGTPGLIGIKVPTPIDYYLDDKYSFDSMSDTTNTYFDFNTIVVLYDVLDNDGNFIVDNGIKYNEIPLGIYFTGIIENGAMTNSFRKFVSNNDIYGSGTSYGLRICSKFMVAPNGVKNIVGPSGSMAVLEDYETYTSLMSELAESHIKMDEIVNSLNATSQYIKDHLIIFKNDKTNVPYIRTVNGVDYWFVNGKNTGYESKGPKGDDASMIGPTGAQGVTGAPGPVGMQGVTGPQGVAGPSGNIGLTGNGIDSFAYVESYKIGGSGTGNDVSNIKYQPNWEDRYDMSFTDGTVTSIKVSNGSVGPQGVTGPRGVTGAQGITGAPGPQGVTGSPGEPGYAPIGAIVMWPGTTLPTSSYAEWLWCDGTAIPNMATKYPELFKVLGGNTLYLPNLCGRFPMGATSTTNVGKRAGNSSHNHNIDIDPDITVADGNYSLSATGSNFEGKVIVSSSKDVEPIFTVTDSDNLPPYYALNFIIRVK